MALTSIIAHRIERSSPTALANLTLRASPWALDGRIEECFRELKHGVLKRTGKDYGRFSDDRANFPLSGWLDEHLANKLSFESFSEKSMQHLKIEIEKSEVPFDGFIIFAHESLEHGDFLHIFLAQHNSGQYIDGDITVSDSLYLDTSGVRLAAKVNLTDWKSDDPYRIGNSLIFLRWRGEKELTDVFESFIGFAERVDLTADTEEFLGLVSEYTKDMPDEIAQQTKSEVVDYCLQQDSIGQPVVLADLSEQLKSADGAKPDAPTKEFSSFVTEAKPQTKPELIPDKSQLKQFIRISGRNDLLSMSFASSCLGETVIYDQESDSLTINNIPPSLKTRLIKHFKGES